MLTGNQFRFNSDFASELLLRINRMATHLYVDGADTFTPQTLGNRQQKLCLGTVSRLVKQGEVRGGLSGLLTVSGFGCNKVAGSVAVTLVTQFGWGGPDQAALE